MTTPTLEPWDDLVAKTTQCRGKGVHKRLHVYTKGDQRAILAMHDEIRRLREEVQWLKDSIQRYEQTLKTIEMQLKRDMR
jgi:uncharacterized protein YlxW (UPF0749 family)